ncbi:MAG TPA: phosphate ABC transporter permease subunit PstC [Thermomicrobiales bacterium]
MIGQRSATVERADFVGRRPLRWSSSRSADRAFEGVAAAFAASIVLLVILIGIELWHGSHLARREFGLGFITEQTWDPVHAVFGAAPFIYGTVLTSLIALLLAAPLGIGTAIFLILLAPGWLRPTVGFLVEMLAAIPSVIYGLWALFVLVPIVRSDVEPFLKRTFGFLPLFQGPAYGVGYLASALVLTIMILPTITAVSQAVLYTVPRAQLEGAYAIGATRWEVITGVALPFARSGIFGATILGLGRALGETMAVTMVIGNRAEIGTSLFALGHTMAAVIANQFNEADNDLYVSALIEIGLILFVVSILLNLAARGLVWRMGGRSGAAEMRRA